MKSNLTIFEKPGAAIILFAWVILVQSIWLWSSLDLKLSFSVFLYGDSGHYLDMADHIAQGKAYNANLPFHPPVTAWLAVPLFLLFKSKATIWVLSKYLMVIFNSLTISILFLVIRRYVPVAFAICLLMPFSFGELVLSSSLNSETVYRLLLIVILWIGFRIPVLSGMLQACACLTRAEHLILWVLCFIGGIFSKSRRVFFIYAMAGFLIILIPYTVHTARNILKYNTAFKSSLPEPLPVLAPISLYGPLNFALAQENDSIFFSRSALPSAPGKQGRLDPLYPPHNKYIVHGYAQGISLIFERPDRWMKRVVKKILFSFKAFGYGWTWRDLPNKAVWLRQPVDMAYSCSLIYQLICLVLTGLGVWSLRHRKMLVLLGAGLFLFRIMINCLFFPYLRSMMIVSPLWLVFLFSGLRYTSKYMWKYVITCLLIVFILLHGGTILGKRDYHIQGRSDQNRRIIQDDLLTITYVGFYTGKGERK